MIHVHVDVDNLWVYEQEYGIDLHKNRGYIYSRCLPKFLNLLKKTRSKATFFIIGQDLELAACRAFCRQAVRAGHEIGNHSWSHPISFHTLNYEQKKQQIMKTHKAITSICGKKPVGFRGPGYYVDDEIMTILQQLHYQYDTSILPGFAQILMTTYAFMKGGENRHKAFGRPQDIFSTTKPYIIKKSEQNRPLLELPISVLPFLRMPISTTFAYVFGQKYRQLILQYLKRKPSYVIYTFHAIDFIDFKKRYTNHPVIPLRYTHNERMDFVQQILDALILTNGGSLKTSRDTTKSLRRILV